MFPTLSSFFLALLSFASEGSRKKKKQKTPSPVCERQKKKERQLFSDRLDKITSRLITVYANSDKGDSAEMSC